MKKNRILFLTLFFFCSTHPMNQEPQNSIPDGLPSFFFDDPEIREWMESSPFFQAFPPRPQHKKIVRSALSATKRSCEIVGSGLLFLAFYLANVSDQFPQPFHIPLFDNDTCPL